MKRFLVLVAVLGLVVFGCAKKEEQKGQYLVKINGVTITQEDLKKEVEALPPFAQKMFEGEEGIARLIDELIKKSFSIRKLRRKGLTGTPDILKKLQIPRS